MGSEPIVGALWFAYVLFLALCLISMVAWFSKIIIREDEQKREHFVIVVLLLIALIQSIASTHFLLTIPRLNLVLTYSWIIYCGKLVMNMFKVKFDCWFVFILCAIGLYSIAVLRKLVQMDEGSTEIVSLTVSSFFALYVLAFVAKKCYGWLARLLALVGRESFYIMGLHFVAFKICYYMVNMLGYHQNLAEHAPNVSSVWILLFYLVGGVMLPVLIMYLWRRSRSGFLCLIKKEK